MQSPEDTESMYFWNIECLKEEMATAPLTDRQVLPYLVITLAGLVLGPSGMGTEWNVWDYACVALSTTLAIFGTIHVYRCNGGEHGRHFLQRYFALGWVVMIRLVVFATPVLVLVVSIMEAMGESYEETSWIGFLSGGILECLCYWRLAHHVADVAKRASSQDAHVQAVS